jgi:hypothetical protein
MIGVAHAKTAWKTMAMVERRCPLYHLIEHFADPAVTHACFRGERGLITEQPVAEFLQRRRGAVVEARQELLLCFARSVNQEPLDLGDARVGRCVHGEFAGSGGKFRPGLAGLGRLELGDPRQRIAKLVDALPARRDHRANRHAAELRGQPGDVDAQTLELRGIRHRQGDDHGPLEFEQLLQQIQALVEVGAVEDGEYPVGRRGAVHVPENHVNGDLLLERMGAECVGAGQVDEFERPVVHLERADVALDRDTRVITDTLPQPGQAIEQCALAGIGVADNRYAGVCAPA